MTKNRFDRSPTAASSEEALLGGVAPGAEHPLAGGGTLRRRVGVEDARPRADEANFERWDRHVVGPPSIDL